MTASAPTQSQLVRRFDAAGGSAAMGAAIDAEAGAVIAAASVVASAGSCTAIGGGGSGGGATAIAGATISRRHSAMSCGRSRSLSFKAWSTASSSRSL